MNFLNQRRKSIFFFSMIIFTFIVACSTFLGDSYIILRSLFDIFIPYNIGYAIQSGHSLHETFRTSFGFIYGGLNFISLNIIDRFKIFEISDLIILSSLIFSVIILFCFFGTRLTFNSQIKPIPYWILLVALPLVFQVRYIPSFDLKNIPWYGTYNHHLWGLLIIQVSSLFCLEKFYRKNQGKNNHLKMISLVVFSFMQAFFSFIGLNYKLNFFIASLFMSFGLFFMMSLKTRFLYMFLFVGFLGLLCGIAFFLGYNYRDYFFDIYHILEVQNGESEYFRKYKTLFLGAFLYIVGLFVYRTDQISSKDLRLKFLTLRSFLNCVLKKISLKNVFFDLCIAGGLFFAIYGSWGRPIIFFLITFSIFILMNSNKKNIVLFSSCFLILFYIVNIFSLLRITQYKFYDNTKEKYVLESLDSHHGPMTFVVKNEIGFHSFIKVFMILSDDKKTLNIKNFKRLSYSADISKEKMDFFKSSDYIRMISNVVSSFKSIGIVKEDKVMALGFINPLPFLLNVSFPSPTYHWIHLGVTFSLKNLYKIKESFKDSDFIFMPLLRYRKTIQTILNCQFYVWNFNSNRPFKIFKITQYGVYFASQEKMKKYHLDEISKTDDREDILSSCNRFQFNHKSFKPKI